MVEKQITAKIVFCALDELSEAEKKLVQLAKLTTSNAYAPYSNFQVGAAVLLDNGEILTGSNQENAAFSSGICAERVVLFYANARYPDAKVLTLAIAAQNMIGFSSEPISPCGTCRQVLLEAENRYKSDIRVLLYGVDGIAIVESIKDLLPLSFDVSSMDIKD
ncbi:MAG: cytidine deaminase [Bacteroidales bacterium]|nr:cytidine deaminase [Bacteroidales bacterium]